MPSDIKDMLPPTPRDVFEYNVKHTWKDSMHESMNRGEFPAVGFVAIGIAGAVTAVIVIGAAIVLKPWETKTPSQPQQPSGNEQSSEYRNPYGPYGVPPPQSPP